MVWERWQVLYLFFSHVPFIFGITSCQFCLNDFSEKIQSYDKCTSSASHYSRQVLSFAHHVYPELNMNCYELYKAFLYLTHRMCWLPIIIKTFNVIISASHTRAKQCNYIYILYIIYNYISTDSQLLLWVTLPNIPTADQLPRNVLLCGLSTYYSKHPYLNQTSTTKLTFLFISQFQDIYLLLAWKSWQMWLFDQKLRYWHIFKKKLCWSRHVRQWNSVQLD